MLFDLPDLLQAEHAGRALAFQLCKHNDKIDILVDASLEGAAALAAARHLSNLGQKVKISLADEKMKANDVFLAQLKVIDRMKLPLVQANEKALRKQAFALDGIGLESKRKARGGFAARDFLSAKHPGRWDKFFSGDNPFIAKARKEDSLPVDRIRSIDLAAINDYSLPGICLMENAGIAATVIAAEMLKSAGKPVAIVAGSGNNGGDALVVARGLLEKGESVRVYLLGEGDKLRGDARVNYLLLRNLTGGIVDILPDDEDSLQAIFANAKLIVDGMFGTGLTRDLEGKPARTVAAINKSGVPILALDLPSGLDGDTGEIRGCCVNAAATVTFAAPKPGFWLGEGKKMCGKVFLADIGCPEKILRKARK
jgi:hydroxyethylthiazole kinase-like uncharacterized protein yjeF